MSDRPMTQQQQDQQHLVVDHEGSTASTTDVIQPTVRPIRPRVTDRAVTTAAANALLPEIAEWAGEPLSDADAECARDMLRGMIYSDAYEIAREFERAGWDANRELVDVLESWDIHLRRAHVAAVMEWIAAHDVRPRYDYGAIVSAPNKPGVTGEVVRVDLREGTYTVRIETLGHVPAGTLGTQGFVYPWEDVEAATDDAAHWAANWGAA